jgi:hypothetical protein
MPIIDEEKSCRPGQGYDSDAARNVRVHQEIGRNAGYIFFAPSSKTQTQVLFFSVIIRQDRYAMGLEQH